MLYDYRAAGPTGPKKEPDNNNDLAGRVIDGCLDAPHPARRGEDHHRHLPQRNRNRGGSGRYSGKASLWTGLSRGIALEWGNDLYLRSYGTSSCHNERVSVSS